MKQYITEQQWNALSEEAQLIIATKFSSGLEKPEFYVKNPNVYIPLSIGEMIEFLYDNRPDKRVKYLRELPRSFGVEEMYPRPEEMCDDLWEAVKLELEY